MNIPYIENDSTDMIEMLIDVDLNMKRFVDNGLTETNTGDYKIDCCEMCNISTFFIGNQLIEFCEPESLIVKEGVFGMMGNHTWIEVDGIIVDATLCQFVPNAKHLSLIDSSFSEYHAVKTYTFEDWKENSSNII